ncbi:MAG: HD domain-containing protein [Telluria sp.]
MSQQIVDITIPDSAISRQITQFIRDTETELLFNHSARVYFWGAIRGGHLGLEYDPELLYAAAMFHDLGITHRYDESALRFEVDGANAAREFLRGHGLPEADIEKVWLAIALHTTPGIPEHMHSEACLIQDGAGMDMAGRNYEKFSKGERDAVISAFPRGDRFGPRVIETFYDALKLRPGTTFGTFNDDFLAFKDENFKRGDLCSIILSSPWQG